MRLLLIFLAILAFSCKKDKEPVPPVITIIRPVEGTSYSAGDAIMVQSNVSTSKGKLASVTLNLLNSNMVAVMPAVVKNVNDDNVSISETLDTPSSLSSGDYYVQVTATTGSEQARKFVKISIGESSSSSRKFFVITDNALGSDLYTFDSAYTPGKQRFFQGSFSHSTISKEAGLLVLSFTDHNLHAIDLVSHSSRWQLNEMPVSSATFGFVYSYAGDIYVAHLQENFVRRYNSSGTATQTVNFAAGVNAYYISSDESHLYFETRAGTDPSGFAVHYKFSGAGKQQTLAGMDVVRTVRKSASEIYLFGNNSGQSQMKLYNVSGNSFSSPHPMLTASFRDVVQIDEDNLLLMFANTIEAYRISTNSMVPFLSSSANRIIYDPAAKEVILPVGKTLYFYDYNSKQIKRTVTFPATVLGVEFVYMD